MSAMRCPRSMPPETGAISPRQAIFLLVTSRLATVAGTMELLTANRAEHDAWLSGVLALLLSAAGLLLVLRLVHRFPRHTLVEASRIALGPWIGTAVAGFFLFYYLNIGAMILRLYADFFATTALPRTPISVILFVGMLPAAYAVRGGLETIARANDLILPVFLLVMGAWLLTLPDWRFERLQPLLYSPGWDLVQGSLVAAAWDAEYALLAMIRPAIYTPTRFKWQMGAFAGLLLARAGEVAPAVGAIALFGHSFIAQSTFPMWDLVRNIAIADFVERVEAIIFVAWGLAVFVKISLYWHAVALGSGQMLGMADYRRLALPLGCLMAALAVTSFDSLSEVQFFDATAFPLYSLTVQCGIPAGILLAAWLRGVSSRRPGGTGGDPLCSGPSHRTI